MEKNIDFGQVADIYDFYTNVDFDINFYRTLCKGRKNVLELMCGTGRISVALIDEGVSMTCVDYSEEMLDIFRKKIKQPGDVKIICQDVCELKLEDQYDLIIIPSNSLAEIIDPKKRRLALRKIYEHLTPNGIFFCTLYNPMYRIRQADGNLRYLGKYDLGANRSLVITYFNLYSPAACMISGTQFYEIYENNRLKEKRCLDIKFAVITEEEICKMARKEGLCLKAIYGDYEPYHYDEDSMFMNLVFMKKKHRK